MANQKRYKIPGTDYSITQTGLVYGSKRKSPLKCRRGRYSLIVGGKTIERTFKRLWQSVTENKPLVELTPNTLQSKVEKSNLVSKNPSKLEEDSSDVRSAFKDATIKVLMSPYIDEEGKPMIIDGHIATNIEVMVLRLLKNFIEKGDSKTMKDLLKLCGVDIDTAAERETQTESKPNPNKTQTESKLNPNETQTESKDDPVVLNPFAEFMRHRKDKRGL